MSPDEVKSPSDIIYVDARTQMLQLGHAHGCTHNRRLTARATSVPAGAKPSIERAIFRGTFLAHTEMAAEDPESRVQALSIMSKQESFRVAADMYAQPKEGRRCLQLLVTTSALDGWQQSSPE